MLLVCLSLRAWSQQVSPGALPGDVEGLAGEEAEELRQYTVEVIVFEYADGVATGEEIFLPEPAPEPPPDEVVVEYIQLPDYKAERAALQNYEDVELEEVELYGPAKIFRTEAADLTMQDTFERLRRLDAYQPILHGGWTQNTVERDVARPIQVRILGDTPLRLSGELTLYLSRYLHLIVDLALDDDDPFLVPTEDYANDVDRQGNTEEDVPYYGDTRTRDRFSYADASEPPPSIVRYRIVEDRIFRSGEVRYFDHPKFGVIAKITRYEVEDPADPPATDEEFLAPAPTSGETGSGM